MIAEELRVLAGNVFDSLDAGMCGGRESCFGDQSGVVAYLFADKFDASSFSESDADRVRDILGAGEVFVSVRGEQGDGVFLTAGAGCAFNDVEDQRVVLDYFPHFIECE